MKRTKKYNRVAFDALSLEKIISEFKDIVENPAKTEFSLLKIDKGDESWNYDTLEEFLAEFRNKHSYAFIWVEHPELSFEITTHQSATVPSTAEIKSNSREKIHRLANIIDRRAELCFVPPPPEPEKILPKPKIFIGHGGTMQWRDLKDHLQDQHGYKVIAYETGSRAGHAIRDIVAEMLESSAFAILVMTGEDKMEDGNVRARQNVIHELGLFQGRLGFSKAIVLKEDETEEFSNISGVHQIRYSQGNIKETFGDILAVLRREFGEHR